VLVIIGDLVSRLLIAAVGEARKAAERAAEAAASAVVKSKLAQSRPVETPQQLRDRVRSSLLRRRVEGRPIHMNGNR
jgi:hypothetical protein